MRRLRSVNRRRRNTYKHTRFVYLYEIEDGVGRIYQVLGEMTIAGDRYVFLMETNDFVTEWFERVGIVSGTFFTFVIERKKYVKFTEVKGERYR